AAAAHSVLAPRLRGYARRKQCCARRCTEDVVASHRAAATLIRKPRRTLDSGFVLPQTDRAALRKNSSFRGKCRSWEYLPCAANARHSTPADKRHLMTKISGGCSNNRARIQRTRCLVYLRSRSRMTLQGNPAFCNARAAGNPGRASQHKTRTSILLWRKSGRNRVSQV